MYVLSPNNGWLRISILWELRVIGRWPNIAANSYFEVHSCRPTRPNVWSLLEEIEWTQGRLMRPQRHASRPPPHSRKGICQSASPREHQTADWTRPMGKCAKSRWFLYLTKYLRCTIVKWFTGSVRLRPPDAGEFSKILKKFRNIIINGQF